LSALFYKTNNIAVFIVDIIIFILLIYKENNKKRKLPFKEKLTTIYAFVKKSVMYIQ